MEKERDSPRETDRHRQRETDTDKWTTGARRRATGTEKLTDIETERRQTQIN